MSLVMFSVPRGPLVQLLDYVRSEYIESTTPTDKIDNAEAKLRTSLDVQTGDAVDVDRDAVNLLCKNVRMAELSIDDEIDRALQTLEAQTDDMAAIDSDGNVAPSETELSVADPHRTDHLTEDTFDFQGRRYQLYYSGELQTLKKGTGSRWGKPISLHEHKDAKLHLEIKSHIIKVSVRHSPPTSQFDTILTRLQQVETEDESPDEFTFIPPVTDPTLPDDFSVTLVDVGAVEQNTTETEGEQIEDSDITGIPSKCQVCPDHGRIGHRRREATHSILNNEGERMEVRYICEACIEDEEVGDHPTLDSLK